MIIAYLHTAAQYDVLDHSDNDYALSSPIATFGTRTTSTTHSGRQGLLKESENSSKNSNNKRSDLTGELEQRFDSTAEDNLDEENTSSSMKNKQAQRMSNKSRRSTTEGSTTEGSTTEGSTTEESSDNGDDSEREAQAVRRFRQKQEQRFSNSCKWNPGNRRWKEKV